MTITAGNSNNGIPMGGYVPGTGSGGGGGVSGDVYRYKGSVPTYTALPAENLETGDVYNVIDTDMNYAWTGTAWDPLGSTVDLSPYYTANQVDAKLSQKQGVLTPQGALSISTYVKSNLHGMSYTPDGTGIYSTTNWGLTDPANNSANPFSFSGTFASSTWGPESIPSYVNIPYSMGQVVITPVKNYYWPSSGNVVNHYSTICAWAGKTLEDGTFIPILPIRAAGTYRVSSASSWSYSGAPAVTSSDTPTTNTATSVIFPYTTPTASSQTNIAGSIGQPSGTNVFQMFEDEETGAISIYIMSNSQSASRGYTYTDLEVCARLKEIDSVLFIPSANGGRITSGGDSAEIGVESTTAVDVSNIGLYSASAPVTSLTFASLGENLYDISGETAKNYLELAIDNSTITLNDAGQLASVMPTASTETLGGVKVDGTSIVIADGVISTNTGTGVDTYTKVEVNNLLSAKQDTITPSSPLSITKEVRSNLEGFQYTTDSTGIYSSNGQYWSGYQPPYSFRSNQTLTGTNYNADTFPVRIIIPYTFGKVVKLPTSSSTYALSIFGKLLGDGTFIPIYDPIKNSRYIMMNDTATTYTGSQIYGNTTDTYVQNPTTYEQIISTGADIDFTLLQLNENEDGSIHCESNNYYPYAVYQFGRVNKAIWKYTASQYVNRLKEINSVMLIPTENLGRNVDTPIKVDCIGLYNNPGSLYNLITGENYNNIDLGENLFDLSGEQAYNYLDLSIDNSTIKVNDSGQLYAVSSAPTNMVTTDTEQTITAKKVHTNATEFQGEVTFHTDSNQGLMFKTIDKSAIAGIKCATVSGNNIVMDFGGVKGESNVTPRFISESDAQITNNSGYNWGRILDTRNFNSRILAGDNITITKNGSGLDSTYTIASTASGGGSYTLPAATADTLGGIKVGSNLAVTDDGTLSATYIPATTASLGVVKPDGTTITVDEDGTIHSTQEGFADLAANNVFTGTNQFQSTVTVGNGFNTAVLNMGPGSGLIFNNSSQAGGKTLSLGTQTGTQVTIYSDGVPIIQRSETRTNQSSSDDNPYTKYDNVDSGNINDILGVSFWKGTQTEYDGITEKDANTLYIITG